MPTWARLYPHNPKHKGPASGGAYKLSAPRVTVGIGATDISVQWPSGAHLQFELEFDRASGSVHVTHRSHVARTYLNGGGTHGKRLPEGEAVRVLSDPANAPHQPDGVPPDAPLIFCDVPNRAYAERIRAKRKDPRTGQTEIYQPLLGEYCGFTLVMEAPVSAAKPAAHEEDMSRPAAKRPRHDDDPVTATRPAPAIPAPAATATPAAPSLQAASAMAPLAEAQTPASGSMHVSNGASGSAALIPLATPFAGPPVKRFFVVRAGALASQQKVIMERRIEELGGELVREASKGTADIVIMARDVDLLKHLPHLAKKPKREWPKVFQDDWLGRVQRALQECLKRGLPLEVDNRVYEQSIHPNRIETPESNSKSASQSNSQVLLNDPSSHPRAQAQAQAHTGANCGGGAARAHPPHASRRLDGHFDVEMERGGGAAMAMDALVGPGSSFAPGAVNASGTAAAAAVEEDAVEQDEDDDWRQWSDDDDEYHTDEDDDEYHDRIARREGLFVAAARAGVTPKQHMLAEFKGLEHHYRNGANNGGGGYQDGGRTHHYMQLGCHIEALEEPLTWVKMRAMCGRHGVGERTMAKVETLWMTGVLPRKERLDSDPRRTTVKLFKRVWGIVQKAEQYYDDGARTLDDLLQRTDVSEQVKLCIRHHDALSQPVPRVEIAEFERRIRLVARQVDERLNVTASGSYRRGEATSTDVDILMVMRNDPTEAAHRGILARLVPLLEAEGLLVHRLTSSQGFRLSSTMVASASDRATSHGAFMGLARTRKGEPMRRLDVKIYPESQEASALLHFTGSGKFNRHLSRIANRLGYRISELGLRPGRFGAKPAGGGVRSFVPAAPYLPLRDEREIFNRLGVQWLEPSKREGKLSPCDPRTGVPWFGHGEPRKEDLLAAVEYLGGGAAPSLMADGAPITDGAAPFESVLERIDHGVEDSQGVLEDLGGEDGFEYGGGDDDEAGLPQLSRD